MHECIYESAQNIGCRIQALFMWQLNKHQNGMQKCQGDSPSASITSLFHIICA